MADNETLINASGTQKVRRGVYSNVATITSQKLEDIVDFYFVDGTDDTGALVGTVVSRVIMSRSALVALRDAIDGHLNRVSGVVDEA